MEVKNTADLKKIMLLCRKNGIKSLRIGEIELSLGEPPMKPLTKKQLKEAEAVQAPQYTDEQMLMWSVQGAEEGTTA